MEYIVWNFLIRFKNLLNNILFSLNSIKPVEYLFETSLSFTVPYNVNLIYINASAGGGGGIKISGIMMPSNTHWNSGGSGAFCINFPLYVKPGDVISFEVGAGGNQGIDKFDPPDIPASNGGNTIIYVNGLLVISLGGGGAANVAGTNGGVGGSVLGYYANAQEDGGLFYVSQPTTDLFNYSFVGAGGENSGNNETTKHGSCGRDVNDSLQGYGGGGTSFFNVVGSSIKAYGKGGDGAGLYLYNSRTYSGISGFVLIKFYSSFIDNFRGKLKI